MGGDRGGTYRVVDYNVETILTAARDKLVLDVPRDGVVHCLVDGWFDPFPLVGDVPDFGDFPGGEIAETELDELSFLEQLVASFHGLFKRSASVWSMKIEDVNTISAELL